jgi:hypothetical protein
MKFQSEADLQEHCLTVLRSKNIRASSEVWVGGIRADIVTPDAVIELKKVLDRDSLYQALGQAHAYNASLHRSQIWLVGQSPADPFTRAQAEKIAREIERNDRVRVSFVDQDEFWQLEESARSGEVPAWLWLALVLAIAGHLILDRVPGFRPAPASIAPGPSKLFVPQNR